MLPLDPALFTLLNANAQTPAISIEAARAISSWLPSLCAVPVMVGLLRGSPALRRTLVLALLSMLAAWAVARLIRWSFRRRVLPSWAWACNGWNTRCGPAFRACTPRAPLPWPRR